VVEKAGKAMTVKQAATRLEVSRSLVYAMVSAGRLRHYRIGTGRGAIRIPEEAIDEFLKTAEVVIPAARQVVRFRHVRVP
jgi:excisionase family DNA binding protein